MIFLGAGASKPFGIPTLEEFSKEIIIELKNLGHEDVLFRIENALKDLQLYEKIAPKYLELTIFLERYYN